jgi:hypothetical protein
MATLYEFDEKDRFFTISCDPYTYGSQPQDFLHIAPEKRHEGWL